jgi:hypothetical protein
MKVTRTTTVINKEHMTASTKDPPSNHDHHCKGVVVVEEKLTHQMTYNNNKDAYGLDPNTTSHNSYQGNHRRTRTLDLNTTCRNSCQGNQLQQHPLLNGKS